MIHDRIARAALTMTCEPGDPATAHHLDDALSGVTETQLLAASDLLTLSERDGIRFLIPSDEEWPCQLGDLGFNELPGPPYGLWVRGPLRLDTLNGSVAVVGSRSATVYGSQVASEFAQKLAAVGRTVVSGGASGIDEAAHRGALGKGGQTVAVLASLATRAYPPAHRNLLNHIANDASATPHGCLVSEVAPGMAPTRPQSLARSRIVAALTQGTVVVEARQSGGTMSTARWANRLKRPVFGVPGPITSATSIGVNELIRRGDAKLVSEPFMVIETLRALDVDEVEV